MADDLGVGILVVLGVQAGLAGFLILVSALDPTNLKRPSARHGAAGPLPEAPRPVE